MHDFQKTLFHPFEAGVLPMPEPDERALYLGAEPGYRLPDGFAASILAVQGYRPSFIKLRAATPAAEGGDYDLALILAGRHRGQNEDWIRDAFARTKEHGTIVVAGGRQDGIESLRKRVAGRRNLGGSLSKHHGVVFWFDRDAALPPLPDVEPRPLVADRFRAAPGMFSHERIDPASRLLADSLPTDIKGVAADFGAGWGFLSARLLRDHPGIVALDLYEADHASLQAARANLDGLGGDRPVVFHWADLACEPVPRRYDVIVMNPPFHAGRAAEPSIGLAMIGAASKALKPRGRLFLVANRGLPYEAALAAGFSRSGEIVRDASFKVLWAQR